jgi:hypothetical protein
MCISLIVGKQRLGKHVPAAINTRNNTIIVGRVAFYAVRLVSKESLWVCVKTRSRGNEELLEASFFYAVRVVSRKVGNQFFPELLVYYIVM